MAWRLAHSLEKLREQINAAYPGRDKSSDGTIGDAAHASRKSDHNPWVKDKQGVGVVTAIDIDEDLSSEIHSVEDIVSAIRASRDPRVKYIIYEGRITKQGSNLQQWQTYTGTNAHKHHAHVSVVAEAKGYDDASPWALGAVPAKTVTRSTLRRGDTGTAVRELQQALGIKADGSFGRDTEHAIRELQAHFGLTVDGIAGPQVNAKLFP